MFVKINHNNGLKKLKLEDSATLGQLKAEIFRWLGNKADSLTLGYTDSEGEVISITSQEDWEVCLEEFKEKNKGKPVLNVSLQFIDSDEFVGLPDFRLSKTESQIQETKTEETAPLQTESEIQEEPKETQPVESFPEDKVIIEVKENPKTEEMTEKKEVIPDQIIETEIKIPEHAFSSPQDLQAMIRNVTDTLGSVFGMEVLDARIEQTPEEKQANESTFSTLTTEQRNEIEELIEEKVSKALSQKRGRKECRRNKRESNDAAFTHFNIVCDGCKQGIRGMARFKSLVIDDYDLCEECEKTGIHPGPMVKFNTPSNYAPFQLNHKFREFIPYFKSDFEKKREEENFEGFRMPHCPFRGERRGPWRNCHQRPQHPHGPHHPRGPHQHPFFKNLAEGLKPFGGLFQNIIQNVGAEINKHTQPKPAAPQQPQPAQTPRQETMTEQPQDTCRAVAAAFIAEFPEMSIDVDTLTQIVRENQLLSNDAIMNHLFM
jgi:hypothetical protein